jgi:hypothetical protein
MALALAAVLALTYNETTIASPVIATGMCNSGNNGQDPASLSVSLPPSDTSAQEASCRVCAGCTRCRGGLGTV